MLRDGLRFDIENLSIMVLLDVIIFKNVSIRTQININRVYMGSYMRGHRLEAPRTSYGPSRGRLGQVYTHSGLGTGLGIGSGLR